ncbi:tail fiber domain-containing protein [Chryseobacterium daeguense]|uniref:tail fiber domain-containing protein n=1 Tax=Chryseobacterium daeguense TaxID=412438 RepID=UPI0004175D0C|nr:tail fiber domain-containing protein [Chryseobacterium daeguense]
MKKQLLILGALCIVSTSIYAQTGNVGINTTAPGTTLDVNGAITNRETAVAVSGNAATVPSNISQVRLTGAATAAVAVTAPAAPNAGQRLIIYNNTTGGFGATLNGFTIANGQAMEFAYSNGGWRATNGGAALAGSAWDILGNTGTNPATNFLGTIDNQDLVIRSNNAEVMRVTAGGRVGIGNSSPIAKLGVHDAIGTSGTPIIRMRNTSPLAAGNTAFLGINSYGAGGAHWGLGSVQQDGTNQYNSKFHIMYSGGAAYQKNFTIVPINPGVSNTRFYVGINTESPTEELDVVTNHIRNGGLGMRLVGEDPSPAIGDAVLMGFNPNVIAGGYAHWAIGSQFFGGTTIPNADFIFKSSAGAGYNDRVIIKNNGRVGILNMNPAYELDVTGSINASSTVRAGGVVLTSDVRLKKDITDLDKGLKTIMALHPVEYSKKGSLDTNNYNRHEIGFIADEVAKVLPSLVTEGNDKDKILSVSYIELIPVLTKAIQDQQKEIENLKSEVKQLADQMKEVQLSLKKSK